MNTEETVVDAAVVETTPEVVAETEVVAEVEVAAEAVAPEATPAE